MKLPRIAKPRVNVRCAVVWIATLGALSLAMLSPLVAKAQEPDPDSESDRLFYEGNQLIAEGKTGEACERFERSLALRRRGGALLNLGLCREAQGSYSKALPLLEEARTIAERDGRAAREETARQHIEALRAKVGWVTITVAAPAGGSALDTTVEIDREPVPRERWGADIPLMPGKHVVTAKAPKKRGVEVSVLVSRAGESHRVEIPALVPGGDSTVIDEPAQRSPPSPKKASPAGASPHAGSPAPEQSLSHASQLGGIVRLDVDPIHAGARVAVGGTVGLGDHCVMGASVLLGRDVGVEPQATLFLTGTGPYKPFVNVAAPIFFSQGDQAGVRLALGLQWDPSRHFGFFAQIGGAYFPAAPEGVAREVLLPAVGAEARF